MKEQQINPESSPLTVKTAVGCAVSPCIFQRMKGSRKISGQASPVSIYRRTSDAGYILSLKKGN